jgi:hypothetical protein
MLREREREFSFTGNTRARFLKSLLNQQNKYPISSGLE